MDGFYGHYSIDMKDCFSYTPSTKKEVLINKIRTFPIVNHCTILYSPLCAQDVRYVHPFSKGGTNDEKW